MCHHTWLVAVSLLSNLLELNPTFGLAKLDFFLHNDLRQVQHAWSEYNALIHEPKGEVCKGYHRFKSENI
jgi:hypothetical protein